MSIFDIPVKYQGAKEVLPTDGWSPEVAGHGAAIAGSSENQLRQRHILPRQWRTTVQTHKNTAGQE